MKLLAPAHPAIADALCATGKWFADHAEPIYIALCNFARRLFWALLAVSAVALLVGSAFGLLP